MSQVRIACPSRLHLGLIDLNGGVGRIDGGVGVALENPQTTIYAESAPRLEAQCAEDPAVARRVETTALDVMKHYDLPPAKIVIERRPLIHVGLGSGTQLLLGVAKVLCHLAGKKVSSADLASTVHRGGTSGIGVASFDLGGFIVDGGHKFGDGDNSKSSFSPTSAVRGLPPAPVIAHYDFPDWDILLCIPEGETTAGIREVQIFRIVCPVPIDEVRQICHLVLLKMMPAVVEKDLETFGAAIEESQKFGFKRFEFRAQSHNIPVCMDFLRKNGGIGVGMSSWGSTIFAFGNDLRALREKTQHFLDTNMGGTCLVTKANNTGMRILDY